MLKPDDKITIEMTALTAAKVFLVLGNCTGDADVPYSALNRGMPELTHDLGFQGSRLDDVLDWTPTSKLTQVAMSIFEPEPNPHQDKIDKLEATIKQAAEELSKLKSEG